MYVKFKRDDDGAIIIEKFESSQVVCVDGIVTYNINGECIYKKQSSDIALTEPNKASFITNIIYDAIESERQIIDLTTI